MGQGPTGRDALFPLGYPISQGDVVFFLLQPTDSIGMHLCACAFPFLLHYQSAHSVCTNYMLPHWRTVCSFPHSHYGWKWSLLLKGRSRQGVILSLRAAVLLSPVLWKQFKWLYSRVEGYVENTNQMKQRYSLNCQLSMSDLGRCKSSDQDTKALKMQVAGNVELLE